jgi:restriction endonuclease S subunit
MTFPLVALGDVCEIRNGATPKTGVRELWDGHHCWITPAEMGGLDSPIVIETRRKLSDAGLASCSASMAPPNSVILSSRAPIGHLVINAVPMATNQGCKTLIPKSNLDHRFLFYYLLSIRCDLEEMGTGATFKELSATRLRSVPIPLPPLADQKRIVALIDGAHRKSASAADDAERSARLIKVLGRERSEAMVVRNEAERVGLGDLCEVLDSKRKPITKADRTSGPFPYYGATGAVDFVDGYIFDEPLVLLGEDGAKWGAGDRSAFAIDGKSWVNNHAHVLRPNREKVRDEWLIVYLNAADLDEYITGATVPKLNQAKMREISVPVPSLGEQDEVLASLREITTRVEELGDIYQERARLWRELTGSVTASAMSGDL